MVKKQYYFVFDFYCQTDKGLLKDIKESESDYIDPWEDMEESFNSIESYFFPKIELKSIEHVLYKSKSKYILRILCLSKENIHNYNNAFTNTLKELVEFGWTPFSLKGIPFKYTQINKKQTWKSLIRNSLQLNDSNEINEKIYNYK